MPGQIKIDDGAGNYTILTNGGSLGSDKTITIPNTTGTMALTSDISAGGLTEADSWRLTTNFTGDATPIASNLERDDARGNGLLGTGMTESSGVFTFPSTGIYLVVFQATFVNASSVSADNGLTPVINVSTDGGSSFATAARRYVFGSGSSNFYTLSEVFKIVDVTDTSQVKVRFDIQNNANNFTVEGHSDINTTAMYFMKLGDT